MSIADGEINLPADADGDGTPSLPDFANHLNYQLQLQLPTTNYQLPTYNVMRHVCNIPLGLQ